MYNGRHCTYEDYSYLVNISKNVLECVEKNSLKEAMKYIDEVEEFDLDIASRMLSAIKIEPPNLKQVIKDLFDELINNVLVDIREHR